MALVALATPVMADHPEGEMESAYEADGHSDISAMVQRHSSFNPMMNLPTISLICL